MKTLLYHRTQMWSCMHSPVKWLATIQGHHRNAVRCFSKAFLSATNAPLSIPTFSMPVLFLSRCIWKKAFLPHSYIHTYLFFPFDKIFAIRSSLKSNSALHQIQRNWATSQIEQDRNGCLHPISAMPKGHSRYISSCLQLSADIIKQTA